MNKNSFLNSKILDGDPVLEKHHHKIGSIVLICVIAVIAIVISIYFISKPKNNIKDTTVEINKTKVSQEEAIVERLSSSATISNNSSNKISDSLQKSSKNTITTKRESISSILYNNLNK